MTIGKQGQVIVSPTSCNLCGVCEKACPIGAIEIFAEIVFVCDLCGGDPNCVKACTEGAIVYEPENTETISLAQTKKENTGKSHAQKRQRYLIKLGREIRDSWRIKNA